MNNYLPKNKFSLSQFSINGDIPMLEQQIKETRYIIPSIAVQGEVTNIFAPPNTGKTLILISELIYMSRNGHLDGLEIYYINCDDGLRGAIEKAKLLEEVGIQAIALAHNGFNPQHFARHLLTMAKEETADSVVVILDTLKKFTDVMQKQVSKQFFDSLRAFAMKGGTVIALAHTNKNKDASGELVYAGTSEGLDDVDCAYILDKEENPETKTVKFKNLKRRMDVESEITFQYRNLSKISYKERLDSVERLSQDQAERINIERAREDKLAVDQPIIDSILFVIRSGTNNKTELVDSVHKDTAATKKRVIRVLDEYTGYRYSKTTFWEVNTGDRNAKRYFELKPRGVLKN